MTASVPCPIVNHITKYHFICQYIEGGKIMNLTTNHEIMKLQLSDLMINPENYRHDPLSTEDDAINYFIENNKTYNLSTIAQDIIKNGLDPSRRILVIKSDLFDNKYQVLEGNRRITSLKLVNSPSLSRDLRIRSQFEQFNLIGVFNPDIECSVVTDETLAAHWILINHTSSKGSLGTVSWNTLQKRRYSTKNGYRSESLILLDHILSSANFSDDIKERVKKFPITNLDRLLASKFFREFLTISFKGNNCSFIRTDIYSILKQIIIDFTSTGSKSPYNVKDIYTFQNRENYIKTLSERLGIKDNGAVAMSENEVNPDQMSMDDLTSIENTSIKNNNSNDSKDYSDTPRSSTSTNNLDGANSSSSGSNESYGSTKSNSKDNRGTTLPQRKFLIPQFVNIIFPQANVREASIFYELKRINIENVNAVSVLFRVFLELSLEHYLSINHINYSDFDSLAKKLEMTSKDFTMKNTLSKAKLKPVNIAISNKNSLLGIDTLNAYVHNGCLNPLTRDLISTWDNYQEFIINLWPAED